MLKNRKSLKKIKEKEIVPKMFNSLFLIFWYPVITTDELFTSIPI